MTSHLPQREFNPRGYATACCPYAKKDKYSIENAALKRAARGDLPVSHSSFFYSTKLKTWKYPHQYLSDVLRVSEGKLLRQGSATTFF